MLGIHYYVFLTHEKYLENFMKPKINIYYLFILHLELPKMLIHYFSLPHFLNEWTIFATTILLPFPLLSPSKVASALTVLKNISRLQKTPELKGSLRFQIDIYSLLNNGKNSILLRIIYSIFENLLVLYSDSKPITPTHQLFLNLHRKV